MIALILLPMVCVILAGLAWDKFILQPIRDDFGRNIKP